ncbi:ribonuclease H-like domain-containing protein [Mycena galopus ATCC 62051]|nr:ribonuclease H-like domain-containing protein [Mycena galopus ATCC 62051]
MDRIMTLFRRYFNRAWTAIISPFGRASNPAVVFPSPPSRATVLEPYPTPNYQYITTVQEANHVLQNITAGAVIGFDTESIQIPGPKMTQGQKNRKLAQQVLDRPTFVIDWAKVDICLVQIATEQGDVYIINIHSMAAFPAELQRIIRDRRIWKVAAGVFSDGQRLWESFREDLVSAISLGLVARLAYPTTVMPGMPFGNEPGLDVIVAESLGYAVSKKEQMSAWDAPELSLEQKNYAAADPHATLQAFLTMRTALQNHGFHVDPNWYSFDIVERIRRNVGTRTRFVPRCSWWSDDPSLGFEAYR